MGTPSRKPARAATSNNASTSASAGRRHLKLGDMLVSRGLLSPAQRDEVLDVQRLRGGAFGAIAEELFGVAPTAVEQAWAAQFAAMVDHVDPRRCTPNPRALRAIERRQAWQFEILPLEAQTDADGQIRSVVLCTTQANLARALRFAGWRLACECRFVLADAGPLGEALCEHYPMAGMRATNVGKRASTARQSAREAQLSSPGEVVSTRRVG